MVTVNKNYLKLPGSYLFSTIAKKVAAYQEANPDVQIVLTAISLDTMAEVMEAVDEGLLREPEIVQITAAKARKLGRHHMMTGQNPIYIISEGEA